MENAPQMLVTSIIISSILINILLYPFSESNCQTEVTQLVILLPWESIFVYPFLIRSFLFYYLKEIAHFFQESRKMYLAHELFASNPWKN